MLDPYRRLARVTGLARATGRVRGRGHLTLSNGPALRHSPGPSPRGTGALPVKGAAPPGQGALAMPELDLLQDVPQDFEGRTVIVDGCAPLQPPRDGLAPGARNGRAGGPGASGRG